MLSDKKAKITTSKPQHSLFSLSWQSIIYGLGIAGRQIVLYLSLPLLTSYIPRSQYGSISVLTAFLSFIDTLSNAGLPTSVFRFYNDVDNANDRRKIVGSSLSLFLAFALLVGVTCYIGALPISRWLLGSDGYTQDIKLVTIIMVVGTMVYFGNILLRIQVRPLSSGMLSFFQVSAQVGLSLFLVILYHWGAHGYWLGQLAGAVVGLGLIIYLTHDILSLRVSGRWVRSLILYATPLILETLALWALRVVDRPIVARLLGLESVAVYEVGYKVGSMVALLSLPFAAAWSQFAFSAINKPYAQTLFKRVFSYTLAILTMAALIVTAFSDVLVKLFAPASYAGAVSVVPWVAFALVAYATYPIVSIGLLFTEHTLLVALISVLAAATNVILNFLLIPRIGIVGAAVATLVAYFVLSITTYFVGRRFYSFPLDLQSITKVIFAAGGSFFLLICFSHVHVSLWTGYSLRLLAVLAFPGVLLASRFVRAAEFSSLRQMITNHDRGGYDATLRS